MIEQTVQELTPIVGTRPACRALGASPATIYRRRCPPEPRPRSPRAVPARALSEPEREAVLAELHSARFLDCSPAQVWATLLDEGRYLASERTMYRLLDARGEVRERRDQRTHPGYAKPELLAERPNELWSWDISKLKGPAKWTYFYLYVILDVFSRYVVGWTVQHREGAKLAKALIRQACEQQRPTRRCPEFPITSQIDGELRELRVRFARTRYRLLYQRSGNLVVLLHAFEKNTGAVPARDRETAQRRMADFWARMDAERRHPPRAAGQDARRSRGEANRLIIRGKVWLVSNAVQSPVGHSAVEAAGGRADRSEAYRDARAEYARIRALREVSPIAAHLRERRFELGLTQEEVAKAAGTSHSAVSRLEKGTHIPQLPTLQRIAAVLDEELLVCFQRTVDGEVEREFAAVA